MDRRQVLQTLGASGASLTMTGIGSAGSTDSSSKDSGIVDAEKLEGRTLAKVRQNVMSNEKVRSLIQKASTIGWRPLEDEMIVMRKAIETEDGSGTIDTAVITFEQLGNERSRGRSRTREKSDGTQANDGDDLYLHFDVNVDKEVESFLGEETNRPELIHFESNSSSNVETQGTEDSLGDQVSVYYVTDSQVQSETIVPEQPQYKTSSNSGITTQSKDYCDVYVRVMDVTDLSDSCVDVACILAGVTGTVLGFITCIKSGGTLCFASFSVVWAGMMDCVYCGREYKGYVSVERDWLEENAHGDDPCNHFTPDHEMLLSKCGLQRLPTKEDYNFPNC